MSNLAFSPIILGKAEGALCRRVDKRGNFFLANVRIYQERRKIPDSYPANLSRNIDLKK